MIGLYIFGGLIVAGIIVIFVFQRRWGKAEKTEIRIREANIAKEKSEEEAKALARQDG